MQRSMRTTNDRLTDPCALFSLSQLKAEARASGCKTLASEGRDAVGVSEDLSLAGTSLVSFVV